MRKADKTKLSIALSQFLLRYRTTPHPTTGKTPAELIFGRRIRTRLDLIHPTQTTKSQKKKSPRSENSRELKVGDAVWMRNYTGRDKWVSGMVISKSGPLSYVIQAHTEDTLINSKREKAKVTLLMTLMSLWNFRPVVQRQTKQCPMLPNHVARKPSLINRDQQYKLIHQGSIQFKEIENLQNISDINLRAKVGGVLCIELCTVYC